MGNLLSRRNWRNSVLLCSLLVLKGDQGGEDQRPRAWAKSLVANRKTTRPRAGYIEKKRKEKKRKEKERKKRKLLYL